MERSAPIAPTPRCRSCAAWDVLAYPRHAFVDLGRCAHGSGRGLFRPMTHVCARYAMSARHVAALAKRVRLAACLTLIG